jgi:hypothetical protein
MPDFLRNISKKIKKSKKMSKSFELISSLKKIFYFHAYGQILKVSKYFFIKKTTKNLHLSHVFKSKNKYRN